MALHVVITQIARIGGLLLRTAYEIGCFAVPFQGCLLESHLLIRTDIDSWHVAVSWRCAKVNGKHKPNILGWWMEIKMPGRWKTLCFFCIPLIPFFEMCFELFCKSKSRLICDWKGFVYSSCFNRLCSLQIVWSDCSGLLWANRHTGLSGNFVPSGKILTIDPKQRYGVNIHEWNIHVCFLVS